MLPTEALPEAPALRVSQGEFGEAGMAAVSQSPSRTSAMRPSAGSLGLDGLRSQTMGCRHSGELDYWGLTSPIGDWPLLQHIPDLIAIGFGAEAHHTRELVFVCLSVAGIIGSVLLARVTLLGTGQVAWFWGFLLIVLSGPLMRVAMKSTLCASATRARGSFSRSVSSTRMTRVAPPPTQTTDARTCSIL